jgi:hypothetical protein
LLPGFCITRHEIRYINRTVAHPPIGPPSFSDRE